MNTSTTVAAPRTTRTRRNHGVLLVGNQMGAVYSSRRERDGAKVLVEVGAGHLVVSASMTAPQAIAMARALIAAAECVGPERAGVADVRKLHGALR